MMLSVQQRFILDALRKLGVPFHILVGERPPDSLR